MEDKILLRNSWMQRLERKMAYQAKSKIIIYVNRKNSLVTFHFISNCHRKKSQMNEQS